MSVSQAEAVAAYQASAGCEEQTVAIEKGCALGHEGWWKRSVFDALMRIELVDPSFGQVSITGFFLRTHGHEEFAELLITTWANQEVLREAVV